MQLELAAVLALNTRKGEQQPNTRILLGFLASAIIIALFFLRNVLRSLFSKAASSVSSTPAA